MHFSDDDLNEIYDRTSGYCHICHRKLAFINYGVLGARGAWEVEHSKPQARGGTHMRTNLYAACIPCNRSKGLSFHKGRASPERRPEGATVRPAEEKRKGEAGNRRRPGGRDDWGSPLWTSGSGSGILYWRERGVTQESRPQLVVVFLAIAMRSIF